MNSNVLLSIILGVALLAAGALANVIGHRNLDETSAAASSPEIAASLARGAAWIWPDSNGPLRARDDAAPYREAAVLVESLVLRAEGVEHGGRTQPLALPRGVRLIPVVHVEAAADAPPDLSQTQVNAIVAAVQRQADTAAAGAGLLQLDFEAPLRERNSYRKLVASVREALPSGVRLSVTALAHWCTQGDWLDRLPVDEVVPMLYRLGPRADEWRSRFQQGAPTLAKHCRGPALGFSTNDPPPSALLARTTRPYWFDQSAWSNPSHAPPQLVR